MSVAVRIRCRSAERDMFTVSVYSVFSHQLWRVACQLQTKQRVVKAFMRKHSSNNYENIPYVDRVAFLDSRIQQPISVTRIQHR